ncbi:MAG: acyltransferase family protein [Actinomycetota bacterium]
MDIQGIRGIGAILVVAYHASLFLRSAFVGLDFFFVISGFVITRVLFKELEANGRISLRNFYSRRVRRLLPALALMLVCVAIASMFILNPLGTQQTVAKTGIATSLISANVHFAQSQEGYFAILTNTNPLLHTWSLSLEEQYYLVFPILLIAIAALSHRFRTSPGARVMARRVLICMVLGSFGLELLLRQHISMTYYSPFTRGWEFGVGAVVALSSLSSVNEKRWLARALSIVGLACISISAFALQGGPSYPGVQALLPVGGTALLIIGGSSNVSRVNRALGVPPLAALGDLSYTWYLWHWPFIEFAHSIHPNGGHVYLAGAGAAALIPSWASHRFVENPIRFNREIVGRRALRLLLIGTLCSILAFSALWGSASALTHWQRIASLQAQTQQHSAYSCPRRPSEPPNEETCFWPAKNSAESIVLVGDSNASQFSEPFSTSASALNLNATLASFGGCPFIDLITKYSGLDFGGTYPTDDCRNFVEAWVTRLTKMKPQLVIIANDSAMEVDNTSTERFNISFVDPASRVEARSKQAKARLYTKGLESILSQLKIAGIPTVVVHAVPQFQDYRLFECPMFEVYLRSCGRSLTRREVERRQSFSRAAESEAVARVSGATLIDPMNVLCQSLCTTNRGDLWLYRDASHLSIPGALTLTNWFANLMTTYAGNNERSASNRK